VGGGDPIRKKGICKDQNKRGMGGRMGERRSIPAFAKGKEGGSKEGDEK